MDLSYSTDMAILWIEKQVLLVEGIIPTGIMARSQVTLNMALRWSAGIWSLSYSTDMAILWIEKQVLLVEGISPTGIMARYQVTLEIVEL